MYFPKDMTFQYFFFDTYIGYFLQALPIALAVGAIYGIVRFGKDRETPAGRKLFACAFICYVTGLVCLVVGLEWMCKFWYNLFYPWRSDATIHWFGGDFDFAIDFFNNITGETIGNFLMFLPFGVLYPLSQKDPTWKRCVLRGLAAVAAIEVLQPIFGRAFDVNDIVLNFSGVAFSTTAFMGVKRALRRWRDCR